MDRLPPRLLRHARTPWARAARAACVAAGAALVLSAPGPAGRVAGASGSPSAAFKRLTVADGLSQGTVWAVHQDRAGFVWIGTSDGLNRYDGYGVTPYFPVVGDTATLGGTYVRAIAEDAGGRLWLGTDGGGLSRYDPGCDCFRRFRHDPGDPASIPADQVFDVDVAPDGGVWVATADGVARLDPETGHAERLAALAAGPPGQRIVHAVLVARDGAVWADGGDGRVVRYDPERGHADVFEHDPADPATPAPGRTYAFLEASDGAVWAGQGGGLTRFEGSAARRVPRADGLYVRALVEDADGAVWVGAYGGGLARVDVGTGAVEPVAGLPTDDVAALALDRTGALWVGTVAFGAAFSASLSGRFRAFLPAGGVGDRASVVRDFAEGAGGRLWVAGSEGVSTLEPGAEVYRPVGPGGGCLQARAARTVAVDGRGRVWAGSFTGGLCVYDPATGASRVYSASGPGALASETVFEVAVDAAGAVWAGTDAGLDRLDPATGRVEPVQLTSDTTRAQVRHVVAGRDGGVWVGTGGRGLFRVDAGGAVSHVPSDEGDPGTLDSPAVYAVYEAGDGAVWAGTAAGLNRVDPQTLRVRRYGPREGLPPGTVNGVVEDADGRLWVSTNRGLARRDDRLERFVVYDDEDGLPFPEFAFTAAHRRPSGTLLFGGNPGFVAVEPERFGARRPAPPVVFTGVEVFGGRYDGPAPWAAREVRLAPDADGLAVTFAALDFDSPRRVRYAYRLDGVDDEWVEAGTRRTASYARVPPGARTLRVRATSADGEWPAQGAALRVVRPAHGWETVWARLGLLAALVGVGVALYRWRVGQLEAVARSRRRLADDLHDDLSGRVAALALAVDLAAGDDGVPAGARERLGAAARAARAVAGDLRDATWAVDGGHDGLDDLFDRMETTAHDALAGRAHTVTRPPSAPARALAAHQRHDLLLAFKEAVHNAARHGTAPVVVRLVAGPDGVGFDVVDTGPGFDPAAPPPTAPGAVGGRGLQTLRRRAERLGATLDVESAPGRPTGVRLRLRTSRA